MSDKCEPPEELRGVDGWHWVRWHQYPPGDEFITEWDSDAGEWCATHLNGDSGRRYLYICPALTPAEADALRAERDAERRGQVAANQNMSDQIAERWKAERDAEALRARVAVLEEALTNLPDVIGADNAPKSMGIGDALAWEIGQIYYRARVKAALSTGSET